MSNLVPPEGMKVVRREYRLRVLAVWCFLIAGAVAAAAGFLLPTYILVSAQFAAIEPMLAAEPEVDTEAYRRDVALVERANDLADRLRRVEEGMTAADAIAVVRGEVPSGITLTGVSFSKEGDAIALQASGTAATREALIAFVAALERNPAVAEATVPIENLAAGTNAPFTATITVRTD